MNRKKPYIIAGVSILIILIGISLGTIGYVYTTAKTIDNVFVENVYIEDLAVGGLTQEEAQAKLEQDIADEMSKHTVVFTNGEISKEVPLSDLGITYNINEIIDQAFKVGHDKGLFEKYQIAKNGVSPEQHFSLSKTIDDSKLDTVLNSFSEAFYKEPVNATLERVNRQFITTKDIDGQVLNITETKARALEALEAYVHDATHATESNNIQVDVALDAVKAECSEASLEDIQTLVASFSTSFNNASPNRNANLKVACDKITTMLLADETFKLSNYLEPFTEAAGYKNAGVIVNGKVEDGIGGGVCQVASTLYNAVLLTDLEIVMRQNHSLAVSYVPLGRDATYSTDAIDFQFKNNSGSPIFIEGYCENNQVIINIYGHKSLKSEYDIKFASELIETVPAPATKYEDDPTLPEGKEVVDVKALDGKRVKLYKIYLKDGKEVNRVLVNTSYYKARAAVVKRGTKKAPTASQPPVDQPTVAPNVPSTNQSNPQEMPTPSTEPITNPDPFNQNIEPDPFDLPTEPLEDDGFAVVQD